MPVLMSSWSSSVIMSKVLGALKVRDFPVVLDFADCEVASSRMVDLVASVAKEVQGARGSVDVVNAGSLLCDVLRSCKVDQIVNVKRKV